MNALSRKAIKEQALADPKREVCGFLYVENGIERVVPCRNVAPCPHDDFVMCPQSTVDALQSDFVVAYYHSHPKTGSTPSSADKAGSETIKLPCWVYSIPEDSFQCYIPSGYVAPLIGRQFSLGVFDCIRLVQDGYKAKFGIEIDIPSRALSSVYDGFSLAEIDAMASENKLIPVTDLKPGTLVCMALNSPGRVTHTGLIIEGGASPVMLHHMNNRPSRTQVYGDYWARRTVRKFRPSNML